ncbi:MAG: carbohydrate kinase family protein [Erysipelotrichaceae bacterium]|nr:carbohydrate kinase family protein [Erysipelotrichaceae bacterium]
MEKYLLCIAGAAVDMFYRSELYPSEGDFTHVKSLGNKIGGCPVNVSAVCAKKGAEAKLLDMLGTDDDTTPFMMSEIQRLGINTDYIYQEKGVINGKCLIVNTNDQRTMFIVDPIRPYYVVDKRLQDALNNATYIYSLMHMINRSFETIEPLLEAKKHGAKIILDGSSKYDDPKRLQTLYKLADGMFINETDYARLQEATGSDPRKVIFNNGGLFVCVTHGSKGSTLYLKDEEIYLPSVSGLQVIDSTGAGDSFAGCFIACLIKGFDYRTALRYATLNGAYACTVFGSTGGVCTFDQLDAFAKEHHYGDKL